MKKKWLVVHIVSLLAFGSVASQVPTTSIPDGKHIDIRFEYINGFIVVPVVFDGIFRLQFIFDTGAEHTILAQREITDILQVDYKRRFTLLGADMTTELYAYLAPNISLQVGQLRVNQRPVLVLEEDYLRFSDYVGTDIQGILGADFFRRYIVQINYRRRVISLHAPSGYTPPKDFAKLPISIERSKPYIEASTVFKTGEEKNLKFLLDSGASLPLLIDVGSKPALTMPEQVVPSNLGQGLGGFLVGYKGRVKELKLPPFEFREVVTSFQDRSELPIRDTSLLNQRNGIIGNEVLSRFTVIIDYIREELYLSPNRTYEDKFEYDRSGLLLVASGPALNEFYIYTVLDDSPAGEVGLKPGDQILRINWVPASMLSLESINKRLRKREGKRLRIVVKRDGKRIRKVLVLRELI
jgi:hypothetical protein